MAKKDRDASSSSENGARARRLVRFKSDLGTEDVAAYLEALAAGLREGRVVVQAAGESIDVPAAARARLDVAAKSSRNAKRWSVELRLSWPKGLAAPDRSIASGVDGAVSNEAPAEDKAPSKAAVSDQAEAQSSSPGPSAIAAPGSE